MPTTPNTPSAQPALALSAQTTDAASPERFSERRQTAETPMRDRRQFASSHSDLSEDARELAMAIDGYKARHRRRYITFEEMLNIIRQLGYDRK